MPLQADAYNATFARRLWDESARAVQESLEESSGNEMLRQGRDALSCCKSALRHVVRRKGSDSVRSSAGFPSASESCVSTRTIFVSSASSVPREARRAGTRHYVECTRHFLTLLQYIDGGGHRYNQILTAKLSTKLAYFRYLLTVY